jgi:hypothetical protein
LALYSSVEIDVNVVEIMMRQKKKKGNKREELTQGIYC